MDVLSRKCKRTIQRHAAYAMPVPRWTAETAHDGVQTRAGEPWMLAKSTQPTRVWATQVTTAVVWPSDMSKRVPLHVPAESNCHSTCSNNSWLILHASLTSQYRHALRGQSPSQSGRSLLAVRHVVGALSSFGASTVVPSQVDKGLTRPETADGNELDATWQRGTVVCIAPLPAPGLSMSPIVASSQA